MPRSRTQHRAEAEAENLPDMPHTGSDQPSRMARGACVLERGSRVIDQVLTKG